MWYDNTRLHVTEFECVDCKVQVMAFGVPKDTRRCLECGWVHALPPEDRADARAALDVRDARVALETRLPAGT